MTSELGRRGLWMARVAGQARWVRRWWATNPVAVVALGIFVSVVALGALVATWAVGEVRAIAHGEATRDAQVMVADLLARGELTARELQGPGPASRYEYFDNVVRERLLPFGLARVKLWDRQGRIVYSSHGAEVGRIFPIKPLLAQALAGRPAAAEVGAQDPEHAGEAPQRPLLEIYVPVTLPGEIGVSGVLEVYKDYTSHLQLVNRLITRLALGVALLAVTLPLALILLVRVAASILHRQQQRLEEAQAKQLRLFREMDHLVEAMVSSLARLIDVRERATLGHGQRVASLAVQTARALGLSPQEVQQVRLGALLHDLGKIQVPDGVLLTTSVYTPQERQIMEQHTLYGHALLQDLPPFQGVRQLVRAHHERYDGQGYPDGLAGEAIPLGARIIAVCDSYDAMTSDRPYRPAKTPGEALQELKNQRGRQFDPRVVDLFAQNLSAPGQETTAPEGEAIPISPLEGYDSVRLFHLLLEETPVAFGFVDPEYRWTLVSKALASLVGNGGPALVGRHCYETFDLWHRRGPGQTPQVCEECPISEAKARGVAVTVLRPTEEKTLACTAVPLWGAAGYMGSLLLVSDETPRLRDRLTQLYDHRFFWEVLAQEMARHSRSGEPLSVIVGDVLNFKRINDRLGYQRGNRILADIAATMQRCVREGDVLCRVGGDEFALLAQHADRRAAIEIGARLAESVREGFQEYGIRLSVGVAGLPEDKGAVGDLFALAEQRLFAAKGQVMPQPRGRG